MEFKEKCDIYINIINDNLEKYMNLLSCSQNTLVDAMRYSLTAGGKRIRPVLALAVCELLGGDILQVMPYACAIEMIHTYSLIHDDLPAMDDDDYRRGRFTNHKVFGEAIAILAGDALLNYAFELMLRYMQENQANISLQIKAAGIIATAAGADGMIGGQALDIESENRKIDTECLNLMHSKKTGALLKAPVLAAATLCNASESQLVCLKKYSGNIGLAFQIKDDILNIEGDSVIMGKGTGSDESSNKNTFVSVHGMENSKKILDDLIEDAIKQVGTFGDNANFLKQMALYITRRDK